ncbi:hypothetical protein [Paenibacillus sp. 1_12]|nr:hypothetical protein [Paenibacillus sp. 1_12]
MICVHIVVLTDGIGDNRNGEAVCYSFSMLLPESAVLNWVM